VSIELAHWSAIVPLAFLALFRRGAVAAHWLVALGFACSFAADTVAEATGGSWVAVPYYLIVQYGLFALAMFAEGSRAMVPPVLAYVVVGGVLYLGMMRYATQEQYEPFMRWWFPYQGVRLASFGLFMGAAWRQA
jgi:hypothetical protein